MVLSRRAAGVLVLGFLVAGCSGDGSSGSGGVPSTSGSSSSTAPVGSGAPGGSPTAPPPSSSAPVDYAALTQAMEARRQAYLQHASSGGGYYAQLSRLATGATSIDRQPIDDLLDFMDARNDTADFKCTALLRILYLHGSNPVIPQDLRDRARQTVLNFKYWVDEPGQDQMVFWSENHQILFSSCQYLAGQRYPQEVFSNSGLTGDQQRQLARPRILRWIDHRLRFGFSEWYSPVYYPHDVAPLLNLADFAQDPDIARGASMVLDLLFFDLARLTQAGSFGLTAGRIYDRHKLSGHSQSIGDLVEILFGTRGGFRSRGSTAGTSFATSPNYRVPRVLLGIGQDRSGRFIERCRNGIDFADASAEGLGFQSQEDGMFWWGMGGYLAPDTIGLSRDLLTTWDLWHNSFFAMFGPLRNVPAPLLSALSQQVAPLSEGSLLNTANVYCFRNGDAQLSSVQRFRPGQVAFQQHAWQATLDLDAMVWTTSPGNLGSNGPDYWTGSGSLPQVVQVEDTAVILYNPRPLQRTLFPEMTHAWFPRAGFDEVVDAGSWTFARKGKGYVALYSAQPTTWTGSGPYADQELWAPGARNVWICQVGNEAEDTSFTAFADRLINAQVLSQGAGYDSPHAPLNVSFQAPDLGQFEVSWGGNASLDGSPIHPGDFPRFDNPYAQQAWGAPVLEVNYAGARLRHDRAAGTRSGDGL